MVSKLSPKKRLVLVLFEIEGVPIEEVAKIAGCPENTAWSRLHYARAELMAMAKRRGEVTPAAPLARRVRRGLGRAAARARRGVAARAGRHDAAAGLERRLALARRASGRPARDAALGESPALDMAALMAHRARGAVLVRLGRGHHRRAGCGRRRLAVAARQRAGAVEHPAPPPGAKSETLAPGARRLTLEGGVEACSAESSVMRLEDGAPRIEGGEVRFSVPHRQPGHPFVVRAEGYRVVVVGTRFGVDVDGKTATVEPKTDGEGTKTVAVDVDEGVVEVWETADGQRAGAADPRRELAEPGGRAAEAPAAPGRGRAGPAHRRRTRRSCRRPGAARTHRHAGKHLGGAHLGARLARRDRDSQRRAASAAESADRRSGGGPRGAGLGRRAARAAALPTRWRRGPARRPRTPPTRSARC